MIKIDIPMPKACDECFATTWSEEEYSFYCTLTGQDVYRCCTEETRSKDCPLQEVKSASLEEVRCEVQCSDCGAEFSYEIFWMARGNARINYCPNCGTKMLNPEEDV